MPLQGRDGRNGKNDPLARSSYASQRFHTRRIAIEGNRGGEEARRLGRREHREARRASLRGRRTGADLLHAQPGRRTPPLFLFLIPRPDEYIIAGEGKRGTDKDSNTRSRRRASESVRALASFPVPRYRRIHHPAPKSQVPSKSNIVFVSSSLSHSMCPPLLLNFCVVLMILLIV